MPWYDREALIGYGLVFNFGLILFSFFVGMLHSIAAGFALPFTILIMSVALWSIVAMYHGLRGLIATIQRNLP